MQSHKKLQTDHPILVTGASGYISGYVIKDLLEHGYKVRGTVRSISNTKKIDHLLSLPNAKTHLELVQADLNISDGWNKAVEGCEYVFHIASPIPPYVPKHEDEVIIPAVNGTKFVTEAAIRNHVKRLVFTSSCLTLFFGHQDKEVLNEELWADPAKCAHYPKSKILAEKALWQLYHKQDLTKTHTDIVAVLPSLVLGPGLSIHNNSSQALIAEILKGGFPGYPTPPVNYTIVDVRDVATGHIRAMWQPVVRRQRIALAGPNINLDDIFHILKKDFPQAHVNDREVTVDQIKSSGNPVAQRSLMLVGKKFKVDNTRSKKALNMNYIPWEKTITDMASQLIKLGVVAL